MSDSRRQHLDQLKQEQGRLEELLFLVDQQRRLRLQKVLASLRTEISAIESEQVEVPAEDDSIRSAESLPELRQRQSELEETLFSEPPERRGPVKKLLAQVRLAIEAAVERVEGAPPEETVPTTPVSTESAHEELAAEKKSGGPQAA